MTESEITLALKSKEIGVLFLTLEALEPQQARDLLRNILNPCKTKAFWRHLDTSLELLEMIAANDVLLAKLVPKIPPLPLPETPKTPTSSESIPEEMLLRT